MCSTFEPYRKMTIRQMLRIWGVAKGNLDAAQKEVEQLAVRYDVDSAKAFERWLPQQGHTLDLFDYQVSLLPQRVDKEGWVIVLTYQPGYAEIAAKYAHQLQEAGVSFIMDYE